MNSSTFAGIKIHLIFSKACLFWCFSSGQRNCLGSKSLWLCFVECDILTFQTMFFLHMNGFLILFWMLYFYCMYTYTFDARPYLIHINLLIIHLNGEKKKQHLLLFFRYYRKYRLHKLMKWFSVLYTLIQCI